MSGCSKQCAQAVKEVGLIWILAQQMLFFTAIFALGMSEKIIGNTHKGL